MDGFVDCECARCGARFGTTFRDGENGKIILAQSFCWQCREREKYENMMHESRKDERDA